MTITLNGTTGITTPDVNVTAQSSNIVTTGNITAVDATLSGGVYVGGTVAANYLDDYEEGTWTPTFFNLGTVTLAYARYTKIGDTVTALCVFGCTSTPTANNSLFTLPFASSAFAAGAWTRSTTQGGQMEVQSSNNNCYFASTASTISGTFITTVVYKVS